MSHDKFAQLASHHILSKGTIATMQLTKSGNIQSLKVEFEPGGNSNGI